MNHVFTCATCRKQWTVVSDHELECFFVGLCYWCIRKTGITFDEILDRFKDVAVEGRFAQELMDRT